MTDVRWEYQTENIVFIVYTCSYVIEQLEFEGKLAIVDSDIKLVKRTK